eukprot:scaffold118237_cov63-Phaeocystis_antarctica.AAC.4
MLLALCARTVVLTAETNGNGSGHTRCAHALHPSAPLRTLHPSAPCTRRSTASSSNLPSATRAPSPACTRRVYPLNLPP